MKNLFNAPVFIVGFPRSGTTLLQALLATQADFFTLPETHFFCHFCPKLEIDSPETLLNQPIEELIALVNERLPFQPQDRELVKLKALQNKENLTAKVFFEWLVSQFHQKGSRLLEKTPDHARHWPLILKFYPDAKFIAIIRHPTPTIASCKKEIESMRNRSLLDLTERWKTTYLLLDKLETTKPESVYIIHYELLCLEVYEATFDICKFINAKFDNNKINQYKVFETIIKNKDENWKNQVFKANFESTNLKTIQHLTENEIYEIQYLLKKQIRHFNYKNFYPFRNFLYYLRRRFL